MKTFFSFFYLIFALFLFTQEAEKIQPKFLQLENCFGVWISIDQEKEIIKIKVEGEVKEFKFEREKIKLLGRQKNLKITDFKEGDFVKVFYKKTEEGVNVITRIIKDPPKPKEPSSSPAGN